MKTLDRYEYLDLLNELDFRHGSFYHLWEMGKPRFVEGQEAEKVKTGAVSFNRDGKFLEFLINEEFWDTLSFHQKAFLIAHECLHVTYNHGYRLFRHAKTQGEVLLMNWACDIVINHRLVELGFNRKEIDPDGKFCWIDTVFKGREDEIAHNRSSEYYYSKLKEMQDEAIEKLKELLETVDQHTTSGGSHDESQEGDEESEKESQDGSGNGQEGEEGDTSEFNDMTELLEELADRMNGDEMNDVAKDFEKRHKELDEKINEGVDSSGPKEAGDSPGHILKRVDPNMRVKPKPKWETVIKKWVKKTRLEEFKVEEQWARTARRFQLLEGSGLILPSEMETDEPLLEKHKMGIYFFLDTSYSCAGYADRFWRAAKSIPTEFFDVRMFCFDTSVYDTSLESGELYGFGGTAFSPIETKIQKVMSEEESKYPDAVFLITDGWGNSVYPEHPERWHWFMTENFSRSYVPSASHVHKLMEFE